METLKNINKKVYVMWYEGDAYYTNDLPEILEKLINNPHIKNFILLLKYRRKKYFIGLKTYTSKINLPLKNVSKINYAPLRNLRILFGLEEKDKKIFYQVLEIKDNIEYTLIDDLIKNLGGIINDIMIAVLYIRRKEDKNSKLYFLLETKKQYRKRVKKIINNLKVENEKYENNFCIANLIDRILISEELKKVRCILPNLPIEFLIDLIRKVLNNPIYLKDEEVKEILHLDSQNKIFYLSTEVNPSLNNYLTITLTYKAEKYPADFNKISRQSLPKIIPYIADILNIKIDLKQLYELINEFVENLDIELFLIILKQNLLLHYDDSQIEDIYDQLIDVKTYVRKNNIVMNSQNRILPIILALIFSALSSKMNNKIIFILDQSKILSSLSQQHMKVLTEIFREHGGKVVISTKTFNPMILELSDVAIIDISPKLVREYLERRYGTTFHDIWRYAVINNVQLKR